MEKIELKNVCLSYKDKKILENVNMIIEKGDYYVLCGKNGSGKSSLVKTLLNLVEHEGVVTIFGKEMNAKNRSEILENISVVFENPTTNLVCETVYDELKFPLNKKKQKKLDSNQEIEKVSKELGIEHLIPLSTSLLSGGEKQLVAFASAMITKPEILVLDEPFTMLDGVTKEKLMKYIKKYYKDTNCTVLHVTHDMEDVLYGNKVGILKDGKILYSVSKDEFIKEDKIVKEIGERLPFMADLSLKLKYYGLLDKPILDMNKMVKYLWK